MSEPPYATITVLLFGPQAAVAGTRSLVVPSKPDVTCAELLDAIAAAAPALRGTIAGSRIAINDEFAAPDRIVHPHDEVALIGPVSGG